MAGTGAVVGMVLWGTFGVRSLAGPTAVFVAVFLGLLVLSAVCEACGRYRSWRRGGDGELMLSLRRPTCRRRTMRTAKELFQELRGQDPELQREYDRLAPRSALIDAMVKARKQRRPRRTERQGR